MRIPSTYSSLAISSILLCCISAACHRDPHREEQKFFNRGVACLQSGKVNEAALQFLNALKIEPKDAVAANMLAEIEFRRRNYGRAYSLLQQAVQVRPDYLPAHRGLAHFYQLAGKVVDAEREFNVLLEHNSNDIDALLGVGLLEKQQKRFEDAEGTFNRILELQPNHVGALRALASVRRSAADLHGAERYLRLAVQTNPRSVEAQLELIAFYIESRRPEDAEQLFHHALEMTSDNVRILQAQAGFYEGLGRYADAERVIGKIQSSHSADARYWRALADFYIRTGDWAKAEAELNHVLQLHPGDVDAMHQIIEVHLTRNDQKRAEFLNEALLKRNPRDSYAHLVKGRIELARARTDKALLEFAETEHYQPDSPVLRYWLAQAHVQTGDIQQARQEFETALRYSPGYDTARLSLAKIDNAMGLFDESLANAKIVAARQPENMDALLAYAEALIGKREFDSARKIINVVVRQAPGNSEGHRIQGLLFLAKGNLAGARTEFRQAWDRQPQSKALLKSVIAGYFVANQKSAAIDFLRDEIRNHPTDALFYEQLGQIFVWEGNVAAAIPALQRALALAPADPDGSILLASVYAMQNNAGDATAVLAAARQKHPTDTILMIRAGMILEKLHKWEDAREAYSKALEIDAGNALAKNNLAWVLAEHGGSIDQALALAQQAKESLNSNPQVTDTIGWVYFKKGLYNMAEQYIKQCVAADQNNATFQYQLGMVESKLGNRDQARTNLQNALRLDPNLPDRTTAQAALAQL